MEPIKLQWKTGNKIRNLKYATKILIKRKNFTTCVREFFFANYHVFVVMVTVVVLLQPF